MAVRLRLKCNLGGIKSIVQEDSYREQTQPSSDISERLEIIYIYVELPSEGFVCALPMHAMRIAHAFNITQDPTVISNKCKKVKKLFACYITQFR